MEYENSSNVQQDMQVKKNLTCMYHRGRKGAQSKQSHRPPSHHRLPRGYEIKVDLQSWPIGPTNPEFLVCGSEWE